MGEETAIGVDLGGTKLRVGRVGDDGVVHAERIEPTDTRDGDAVLAQVTRLVHEVGAGAWAGVTGVGVGVPAAVDPRTGSAALAQNLPGLVDRVIGAELAVRLDRPVIVDNDAALALVGEHWVGAARGVDDVVLLSVGTGIGAGIMAGGRLLRGHHGAAGEVADLPLGGDPTAASAQRAGVFESVVGTAGLTARAAAIGHRDPPSLFAAVARGESAALDALATYAASLALGVVALVAVLDPQRIVLAGGIGAQPPLRTALQGAVEKLSPRCPTLVTAALGQRAGMIGAARHRRTATS